MEPNIFTIIIAALFIIIIITIRHDEALIGLFRPQFFSLRTIRQTTYDSPNTQTRSRNHCCSGKAISVTYSECVFVDIGIQQAMRMCHIVMCGLFGSTIFFHIIS